MNQVGTVLIGCGKVASAHAQAYETLGESNFIGVYDANPQRAAEISARYKVQAFDNLQAMLHVRGVQVASYLHPSPNPPRNGSGLRRSGGTRSGGEADGGRPGRL